MRRAAVRGWIAIGSFALLFAAGCKHCKSDDTEAATCPAPLHPDYCRHDCKSFLTRRRTRHAGRVDVTEEGRVGTCGKWNVFTQRDVETDASILEYFDPDTEQLVGAVDPRRTDCTTFGTVPTCTVALRELPWPWADYRIVSDVNDERDGGRLDAGADAGEAKLESDFDRESEVWDCYTEVLWADASAKGTVRLALARADGDAGVSVEALATNGGLDDSTTKCIVGVFRSRPPTLAAGEKTTVEIALHPLEVRDR